MGWPGGAAADIPLLIWPQASPPLRLRPNGLNRLLFMEEDMANLIPYSSPIDDLLSGFFVRPLSLQTQGMDAPLQFRMDVHETENAYRVVADLPGVRKEYINVKIDGADVEISAEARREQNAGDGEKALLNERVAGKYYRRLSLGHDLDEANAQAKYVDGVLELTLPKSPDSMPKRITIQ
jgi:HSP20 family protein